MKKVLPMIFFFIAIITITSVTFAFTKDKVYKDTKVNIDFIVPVSCIKDENNRFVEDGDGRVWAFLTKEKKSRSASRISSADIKKYKDMFNEKQIDNNSIISFILVSLNKQNKIEEEIIVKSFKGDSDLYNLCTYSDLEIKAHKDVMCMLTPEIQEALKLGYNAKYTFCGYTTWAGQLGRRKSYQLTLSNGKKYLVVAEAGRLGKKLQVFGYGNGIECLQIINQKINAILAKADFDATFEKGYFEIELEGY